VKEPVFTRIPGDDPIELIAYYDEFKGYYPDCEIKTKEWFVNNVQQDWVIFDCGANIGYYSILFSRLAPGGHIYAFEPTSTYDMLITNLNHHKASNVIPVKKALGKNTGQIRDSIFRIWGHDPEKQNYSFTTIDDFVKDNNLARLDCIKIDVDSFDFEVLQGAKDTMIKFDPFIIVELNHALNKRHQYVPQVLHWLTNLSYKSIYALDYDNFLLKRNFTPNKIEEWPDIKMCFNPRNYEISKEG